MQKTVKAGRPINEDDIPPNIVIRSSGGSTGGSSETSSTSSAAFSPSEDQAPPPVPPHSQSPSVPHTTIPHDVVFHGYGKPTSQAAQRSDPEKQVRDLIV